LEVEAVNTSQHEDEGKRREECTHNRVGSVAKSSASVGTGVRGGGRGDAVGEGVRGAAAGREDEAEEEVEEVTIGGGGGGARAGMVKSCSQARAGMVIMAGSSRVAGVDVDAAEVEDRMGRAGTEGGEGSRERRGKDDEATGVRGVALVARRLRMGRY
jgi:hypothetical protein